MARKTLELPISSGSTSGDYYVVYDSSTGLSKRIDHDNMPNVVLNMVFMIHQASQMQLNQIQFIKSLNNNWV